MVDKLFTAKISFAIQCDLFVKKINKSGFYGEAICLFHWLDYISKSCEMGEDD